VFTGDNISTDNTHILTIHCYCKDAIFRYPNKSTLKVGAQRVMLRTTPTEMV